MTKDLNTLIAKNLRYFMSRPSCEYRNPNALGVKAGISPNTVRYLLDYKKRTVTRDKPEGYPTLDTLGKLAGPLGCKVWELLHPDIERSLREREMYRSIEADFNAKPPQTPNA